MRGSTGSTNVVGALVVLDKPIDFKAVDRQPVDLVFGLFAPLESGVAHLKALALVSRTMRDQALCTRLRANTDPAMLYMIVTEAQAAGRLSPRARCRTRTERGRAARFQNLT